MSYVSILVVKRSLIEILVVKRLLTELFIVHPLDQLVVLGRAQGQRAVLATRNRILDQGHALVAPQTNRNLT